MNRIINRQVIGFLCLLTVLLFTATASVAQTQSYWKSSPPATGDWSVASNWIGSTPWAPIIDNGGTANITSPDNLSGVLGVTLADNGGNGWVNMSGGTLGARRGRN